MTGSLFYTAQKTSEEINERINELNKAADESDGLIIAQSDDEIDPLLYRHDIYPHDS